MGVTISEVAKVAGVSTATVSLALRGNRRVKEETQVRVRAVAAELNYKPNALGRALALQRSHIIGVIVMDVGNPFYGELVHGAEETASQNDYNTLLCNSRYDVSKEKAFIEDLMGNRAEGLIIDPAEGDSVSACFEEMKRHAIPFVLLRRLRGVESDYVMVDDEMAAYQLTKHLIDLGYEAIGYIGNAYSSGADHDRFAGYKRALQDNGLRFHKSLVRESAFKMQDGYEATKDLLSETPCPRAVVAFSDILAMGALRGAREMGRKVPEDLAVVGFDDIEFAACCEVPLTTMALPKYELGKRAVELLLQRIKEKRETGKLEQEAQHVFLEPELVIRKSCGAGA